MKFDELDQRLRLYETAHDQYVVPNMYMVARIDGRSFTRLTKEVHQFESPYDERFRDYMVETCVHLMNCGFRVVYGYTQSDEISLLFHRDENSFGRKLRKLTSILAGEASARFSVQLQDVGAFDCRISQLPSPGIVVDYFRWRHEDAYRNALSAHCYWALRREGASVESATNLLTGMSTSRKNELLFQRGINFNDLPRWQKRGIGLYWETYQKEAHNPKRNEAVLVDRRRLKVDMELPMKDEYGEFVRDLLLREHRDMIAAEEES